MARARAARARARARARDGWLKPGGHTPHGICSERHNGSSCGSIYSWALEEMELGRQRDRRTMIWYRLHLHSIMTASNSPRPHQPMFPHSQEKISRSGCMVGQKGGWAGQREGNVITIIER